MSKLNNKNVIQWFVCLVRRDMESYAEDKRREAKAVPAFETKAELSVIDRND